MHKVLVVDDDQSYIELLQDSLQADGYKILTAHDGKEGLEIALRDKPDLILLDIIMPVMDGLTMLENLRKDQEYGANVELILLTNLKYNEVITEPFKVHTPYYLIKGDIKIDVLKEKVKELLDLKSELPVTHQKAA